MLLVPGAGPISTEAPPSIGVFRNRPTKLQATHRPSGETAARLAELVPARGRASRLSMSRTKSRRPPGDSPVYTMRRPSGVSSRLLMVASVGRPPPSGKASSKRTVGALAGVGLPIHPHTATAVASAHAAIHGNGDAIHRVVPLRV